MIGPYTEDQFTDWFPPHVKPVRPGVYPVDFGLGHSWCFWSGAQWANSDTTPDRAAKRSGDFDGAVQDKRWRGLNFDPAVTALQQFAESIEFSGPDGDGLFWMHAGAPGGLKMAVDLGPECGVVARAAAQLEQLRAKALMECKR